MSAADLTPEALDRLVELHQAATRGPWAVPVDEDGKREVWSVELDDSGEDPDLPVAGALVAEASASYDAELIVAAVNALVGLVEEVKQLRAKLDMPCGSCHPCTEWANQTWVNAGERLPHVHEWQDIKAERDQARAIIAEVRKVALPDDKTGRAVLHILDGA